PFLKLIEIEENHNFASVSSPLFVSNESNICFTFHFYLFGSTLNDAAVELLVKQEENENVVWKTKKSFSDKWQKVRLTLNTNNRTTQLKFNVFKSDVAFADFSAIRGKCVYEELCDFESDTCSWTQPKESKAFKWKRGTNSGKDSLPTFDHTTRTKDGHFMYTEVDGVSTPESAALKSKVFDESFGVHCLQFWYYKSDNSRDEIDVWLEDADNTTNRKQLWLSSIQDTHTSNQWQLAQATIGATKSFQISIESSKRKTGAYTSSIAIDDVRVKPGECHSISSCDFNDDTCGFTIDASNTTLLHGIGRVQNIHTMPKNYKPPTDIKKNGLYVYSDFSNITEKTVNVLISEVLPPVKEACISFYYFIHGEEKATDAELRVLLQSTIAGAAALPIFSNEVAINDWRELVQDIVGQEHLFKIYFEMIGTKRGTIIAIDGIKYSSTKCSNTASNLPKLIEKASCNFEDGFCNYIIRHSSGSRNWVTSVPHDSKLQFPSFDITTHSGKGKYAMFAVDDSYAVDANFHSEDLTGRGWRCITFWYSVNAFFKITPLFRAATQRNSEVVQTLFVHENRITDGWQQVKQSFYVEDTEAINFYGRCSGCVIAVDEIKVYEGMCPDVEMDYLNCDFENGQCGFVPQDNDQLMWRRLLATEITALTFVDANNVQRNVMALDFGTGKSFTGRTSLFSPRLNVTDTVCISFDNLINANGAIIKVYKLDINNDEKEMIATQNLNEKWERFFYETNVVYQNWKLAFEAQYEDINLGVIAVDNILVHSGKCKGVWSCDFEQKCLWKSLPLSKTISTQKGN
ncbi:Apical endosomal glycoprotein-like protein, partial [Leptotrombidium deliense]